MLGDEELFEIRAEIARLSGSGKRLSTQRTHGLYTSFTLPGLDGMPAVRDTLRRLRDFGVPDDLSGKTAVDVGANVGAISLELVNRGARVTAVEYRQDRLDLISRIQLYYEVIGHHRRCERDGAEWRCFAECQSRMRHRITCHLADLNDHRTIGSWSAQRYDVVICCSVDEYVTERADLYQRLSSMVAHDGTLYLESNVQDGTTEIETQVALSRVGLAATYLGNGHSGGISRKRKLFVCRKGEHA